MRELNDEDGAMDPFEHARERVVLREQLIVRVKRDMIDRAVRQPITHL